MTIVRTKRLSNPRKVSVTGNPKKRTRKMTPKQIKFFGTKRQRSALKAKRTTRPRTAPNARKQAHRNPSLVLTLGPVMNPRTGAAMPAVKINKKRRSVAKNRRRVAKRNPSHRPRTKIRTRTKTVIKYRAKPRRKNRRNPTRVVVMQRKNSHRRRSKRNPSLFGSSLGSKTSLMILGGGFTGLVAAKFIPTMLPTSMTGSLGASGGGRFVLTLGSALVAAWAAAKFVGGAFGDGVLFGGLIQAGSVALNAFLPSVYSSLGIGLGDLLPGSFVVPQNPIRAGMAPAAPAALPPGSAAAATGRQGGQARVTMSGLARAYGNAF